MYYKVTDTNSEIFKNIRSLRLKEIQRNRENLERVEAIVGLEFDKRFGRFGQQNLTRTEDYWGFEFKKPDQVNPKIWKEMKGYPGFYEPYTRTKLGREMRDKLGRAFISGWYSDAFEALGMEDPHKSQDYNGKFFVPYLEASEDVAIIGLNDIYELSSEAAIPIKRSEFDEIFKSINEAQSQTS